MANIDELKRVSFNSGQIRGAVVTLTSSFTTMIKAHAYPTIIQGLLGELAAATLMLKTLMNFQGRLHIHAKGNGHLQLLCLESDEQLRFRGLAQLEGSSDNRKLPQLLGDAQLAITTLPNDSPTYQGIVPLTGNTLNQCIEAYFDQSEQIPTRLWLACDDKTSAGFLLQKLPSQTLDDPDEWNRLTQLAETITPEEMLELPVTEWLSRLFHQEDVRVHETLTPAFSCRCSREKFLNNIKTLARDEIQYLLDEEGSINVVCDFCQTHYAFDLKDFD